MAFQSKTLIANHFAFPRAKYFMLAYSSWIQRMFTDHSIDEPSVLLPERSVVLGYRQCCLGQQRAHRCVNRPASAEVKLGGTYSKMRANEPGELDDAGRIAFSKAGPVDQQIVVLSPG